MVDSFEVTGRIRSAGQAASLNEASARLPHGAYTTLRTYRGVRVLRLAGHLARLNESAASLGTPGVLGHEELRRAIAAALAETRHPESRLRVTYVPPQLFVSIERFTPPPASLYREGACCVTIALRRTDPQPKDTRFIRRAAEARQRLPPGTEEGLMVDERGALLEGLSSNLFGLCAGKLHTEDERALRGITRGLVLEVARGVVPVELEPPRLAELGQVRECFLTSASRGILPVARIDGTSIGDGRPGQTTRELARRLAVLIEDAAVAVL